MKAVIFVLMLLSVGQLFVGFDVVAAELKVLKQGLGSGTITSEPAGINCGASCDFDFNVDSVTLIATAVDGPEEEASTFAGWAGVGINCPANNNRCVVDIVTAKNVRATFSLNRPILPLAACAPNAAPPNDCSHDNIRDYLQANSHINTPARFLAALPPLYKQNWILMTRSESLQTGTAKSPRILLPSYDARFVFSIGMAEHASYPGSHPNAIEYMQWDVEQQNFRFHEIILSDIEPLHQVDGQFTFGARFRGVEEDDAKCSKCHSTKNVANTSMSYGTAPRSPTRGQSLAKNKPNWDAYDSWAGMTPFNRDRIYQGSVEEKAFRHIFNLWNWRSGEAATELHRQIFEQLKPQPDNLSQDSNHYIAVNIDQPSNEGYLTFGFEAADNLPDQPPSGAEPNTTNYNFNNLSADHAGGTVVNQEARYVTLRHTGQPDPVSGELRDLPLDNERYQSPISDEGRGVEFFDILGGLGGLPYMAGLPDFGGDLNPQRVADELINHHYATSDIPIDVRPIALAIAKSLIRLNPDGSLVISSGIELSDVNFEFFNRRNGLLGDNQNQMLANLLTDTQNRMNSLPRRKADIQKLTLDRQLINSDGQSVQLDSYLAQDNRQNEQTPTADAVGLIDAYAPNLEAGVESRRREIFRRSIEPRLGSRDRSGLMGAVAVDREIVIANSQIVTLFRYFLEPLGVAVDSWSMSVRGRSRGYNFADIIRTYTDTLDAKLSADLVANPPDGVGNNFDPQNAADLLSAVNLTLSSQILPDPDDVAANIPTFTDIQRIFNKSCIECHGGLNYPPYYNFGTFLDLSEQEQPPEEPLLDPRWNRLARSYQMAAALSEPFIADENGVFDADGDGILDAGGGDLYDRIARHANEDCSLDAADAVGEQDDIVRSMPCGSPKLSNADIQTIARWIQGGEPRTAGDPHIVTIDGVAYDFQAAGEFILTTGPGLEVQTRQTAIAGTRPLGPNAHTGLTSCVSVNGAVAMRVGNDRITYQPNLSGIPDASGLQLRIDGKRWQLGDKPIPLPSGGRIIRTSDRGGLLVEVPGGTKVMVNPRWMATRQLWYMNIDLKNARGTKGLAGFVGANNWLPALPDGTQLGARPDSLKARYDILYNRFGEAWRVTDETSLFDYAANTSTQTFSYSSWPNGVNPTACNLVTDQSNPNQPSPQPTDEITPLTIAEATPHCAAITDAVQRDNCIADVAVTADIGFAQAYLDSQTIFNNKVPSQPQLNLPLQGIVVANEPLNFSWDKAVDADGDSLDYHLCVWPVNQSYNLNECMVLAGGISSNDGASGVSDINSDPANNVVGTKALLVVIAILLLLIILLMAMKKPILIWLVLTLVVVIIAIVLLQQPKSIPAAKESSLKQLKTDLKAGESYYWKVVADDGKGGTTASLTRKFKVVK